MPTINPIDIENISTTFGNNAEDLLDTIWFSLQLQKLKTANDDSEGKFDDYSEEQKKALGLSDEVNAAVMNSMFLEACKAHMSAENPHGTFRNIAYGIEKVLKREYLEEYALYEQVLALLPEDEPNREEKAMYLFNSSGLRDPSSGACMSDFYLKATGQLQAFFDATLEGKNHNGNWRETTIGEVLDELGFDEAQKQAFIEKHDYASLDETFYDNEMRRNAHYVDKSDNALIASARQYLGNNLLSDAKLYAQEAVREELSPEEAADLEAYDKLMKVIWEDRYTEKIGPWIEEKGQKISDDINKVRIASTTQKGRMLLEGGKSLNNINTNAPLEDVLANQKNETAYIGQIIKGEKTTAELLDNIIEKGNKELPTIGFKTAKEYIDDVKSELRENPDGIGKDKDRPYKQFATIFAARILANSQRGSKLALFEEISGAEVYEVAERLQQNPDFRNFISESYLQDRANNYAKLRDAEDKLCNARTHGGFIEDKFKKYLLKKKPGELENSPELARFMPTAKERIEELKRQVKNNPDDRELQKKAAAEIIAIRNACKVERKTGYNLDKQIPPARGDHRLDKEVEKLTQDPSLGNILQDDNTRRELLTRYSHGGKMMTNVRKQYDEQAGDDRNEEIDSALKKNTVGNRRQELCDEAREVNKQLGRKNTMAREKAMNRSREILGEYMALMSTPKKPLRTESDVPWKNSGLLAQDTVNNPAAAEIMKSPEKVSAMMEAIASGDVDVFQNKLKQEMDAVNAPVQQHAPEPVREKGQGAPEIRGIG